MGIGREISKGERLGRVFPPFLREQKWGRRRQQKNHASTGKPMRIRYPTTFSKHTSRTPGSPLKVQPTTPASR